MAVEQGLEILLITENKTVILEMGRDGKFSAKSKRPRRRPYRTQYTACQWRGGGLGLIAGRRAARRKKPRYGPAGSRIRAQVSASLARAGKRRSHAAVASISGAVG